ncbi:hypothetical protein BDF22DRAFT_676797 [Syncephalis plumigaleata]|nr:hypothetical protein BDF22DRAFT_676797 [Syncephalis plumigaleata]
MVTAIMDPVENAPSNKMVDSKKRRLSSILGSNWPVSPESKQQQQQKQQQQRPTASSLKGKKTAGTTAYTVKTPEKVQQATRHNKENTQQFRKLKEYCRNVVPDSFLHICYRAGYDTIPAITAMNVNMNDRQCDFNVIERYAKHPLPSSHKAAFAQFVKGLQQKNTTTKGETDQSPSLKRKYNEMNNEITSTSDNHPRSDESCNQSQESNTMKKRLSKRQRRRNKKKTINKEEQPSISDNKEDTETHNEVNTIEESPMPDVQLNNTESTEDKTKKKKKKKKRNKNKQNDSTQSQSFVVDDDKHMNDVKDHSITLTGNDDITAKSLEGSHLESIEAEIVDADAALEILAVDDSSSTSDNEDTNDTTEGPDSTTNDVDESTLNIENVSTISDNDTVDNVHDTDSSSSTQSSSNEQDTNDSRASTPISSNLLAKDRYNSSSLVEYFDHDRKACVALAADALVTLSTTPRHSSMKSNVNYYTPPNHTPLASMQSNYTNNSIDIPSSGESHYSTPMNTFNNHNRMSVLQSSNQQNASNGIDTPTATATSSTSNETSQATLQTSTRSSFSLFSQSAMNARRAITTLSQIVSSGRFNPLAARSSSISNEQTRKKTTTNGYIGSASVSSGEEDNNEDTEEGVVKRESDYELAASSDSSSSSSSDSDSSSDDESSASTRPKLRMAGQRTSKRKRGGDLFDLAKDMK